MDLLTRRISSRVCSWRTYCWNPLVERFRFAGVAIDITLILLPLVYNAWIPWSKFDNVGRTFCFEIRQNQVE